MDTRSTTLLEDTLRDRLFAYVAPDASTLAAVLGTALFWDEAPANAGPLWGVLRLMGMPKALGYSQQRMNPELEIQLFARRSEDRPLVKHAGDLLEQACLQWVASSTADGNSGLLFVRDHYRTTTPRELQPERAGLCSEYHRVSLVVWPQYLFLPTAF